MHSSERWTIPVGDVTTSALVDRPEQRGQNFVAVLGHGASANMEHRTMANLAGALLGAGLHVVRFNFLYTEPIPCASRTKEHENGIARSPSQESGYPLAGGGVRLHFQKRLAETHRRPCV